MDSRPEQTKISEYQEQLAAWLVIMPQEEREDILNEIEQHLDGLAAEHELRGRSPEDAVAEALTQFGSSYDVGSRIVAVWFREKKTPPLSELFPNAETEPEPSARQRLFRMVAPACSATAVFLSIMLSASYSLVFLLPAVVVLGLISGVLKTLGDRRLLVVDRGNPILRARRTEILSALEKRTIPPLQPNATWRQRIRRRCHSWLEQVGAEMIRKNDVEPSRIPWVTLTSLIIINTLVCAVIVSFPITHPYWMTVLALWLFFCSEEIAAALFPHITRTLRRTS